MWDKKRQFPYLVKLISRTDLQIRHNALEACRVTANRVLEKALGRLGFQLRIRVYPHHMLRENPLASGAGADRLSTGMKMSFGKVVGIAARVFKGDTVLYIGVQKKHIPVAKKAMDRVRMKLPNSYNVVVEKNPRYEE
jgi:large subunit ribosomal protein L10e